MTVAPSFSDLVVSPDLETHATTAVGPHATSAMGIGAKLTRAKAERLLGAPAHLYPLRYDA
jgi:hypothetical protein